MVVSSPVRAGVVDPLEAGRRALLAAEWTVARDAFAQAVAQAPTADAWDGLAIARWWLRDPAGAIDARTRAYAVLRRERRWDFAARVAVWLAREHYALFRNEAVAGGWLARARASLANAGPNPSGEGWLALAEGEQAVDPAAALEFLRVAVDRAREASDADLEIAALARLGVGEVARGAVDEGIALLDEAMTAATAGEGRDPACVGEACCALMEVIGLLGDADRVASWADAVDRFRRIHDFAPLAALGVTADAPDVLSAFCGTCCGGIHLVTGRLEEAETELVQALHDLRANGLQARCVHPASQLAELRILQGRLEEAELLLEEFVHLPECARPLAAHDLASGRPARAVERLHAAILRLEAREVATFPLLTLLVGAQLESGALDDARDTAVRMGRIAAATGSARHRALTAYATARITAATDVYAGGEELRAAARLLADAQVPLEACRARLAHARLLAARDDAPAAATEARATLLAFERLGASADADVVAAFLRDLGVRGRTGPKEAGSLSKRERQVLALVTQGLSNAESAERLHISVKTAGHHVSNILNKLGVRSRTEAAAYAVIHLGREPARR